MGNKKKKKQDKSKFLAELNALNKKKAKRLETLINRGADEEKATSMLFKEQLGEEDTEKFRKDFPRKKGSK